MQLSNLFILVMTALVGHGLASPMGRRSAPNMDAKLEDPMRRSLPDIDIEMEDPQVGIPP